MQKLFNKYFIFVWFASFGLNLTQNILNNSVSLYVTSLNLSTGFAGSLGIAYAITAVLMRFIGGHWVDTKGRRSLLVFGCAGFGLTSLLFGLLPAAAALLIFRAMHGFCFSAGQLAGSTVNVDVTPTKKRTLGVGIYWASCALAFGIAGYIVTWLTSDGTYHRLFIVCCAVGLFAGLMGFLCDYEKKGLGKDCPAASTACEPAGITEGTVCEPAESGVTGAGITDSELTMAGITEYTGLLRYVEPKAFKPSVLMFLMATGNSSTTLYLLLFAKNMGYTGAGLAFIIAAIGMAIGNLGSDFFLRKLGARNLLILTYLVSAVCYASMALIPIYPTYLMGGFACGFIQGVCMPVLYLLSVHNQPVERRGVAGGTVYVMLDIGVGIGSLVWGILIDAAGFTAVYLIAAGVFFLAAVLSLVFYLGDLLKIN